MNKQKPGKGIEWTNYTWNPIAGCRHGCQWRMPDGSIAECYAKTIAERVAQDFYPDGFESHYWHPDRLDEPSKVRKPSRIFIDSMSDLLGTWVPRDQIIAVLEVCAQNPQHSFQLLTKNAPAIEQWVFPANVWVGVSSPPDFMCGKQL